MPVVSKSGELLPKMLVILYEREELSDRVEQQMFNAENLYVTWSRSGKMTYENYRQFLCETVSEMDGARNLLLLDSYGCHKDKRNTLKGVLDEQGLDEEKLRVKIIPPGTTSRCQPLDLHFFRMYKHMFRFLSHKALHFFSASQSKESLQKRDNILKMHSLVYNQFRSPRFTKAHQYGWKMAGLGSDTGPFQNTTEFCLKSRKGVCLECEKLSVIKCGWCTELYCFEHFFLSYHYCQVYVS